jgi:hypothetical protein
LTGLAYYDAYACFIAGARRAGVGDGRGPDLIILQRLTPGGAQSNRWTCGRSAPRYSCPLGARFQPVPARLDRCALEIAGSAGTPMPRRVCQLRFSGMQAWALEDPVSLLRRPWALMESVDSCTMCIPIPKLLGGKPLPLPGFGCDVGDGILLLRAAC